jgi:hypothetical protein
VRTFLFLKRHDKVTGRPKEIKRRDRGKRKKDGASATFPISFMQSNFHGYRTHAFYHFFFILGDEIALKRG